VKLLIDLSIIVQEAITVKTGFSKGEFQFVLNRVLIVDEKRGESILLHSKAETLKSQEK